MGACCFFLTSHWSWFQEEEERRSSTIRSLRAEAHIRTAEATGNGAFILFMYRKGLRVPLNSSVRHYRFWAAFMRSIWFVFERWLVDIEWCSHVSRSSKTPFSVRTFGSMLAEDKYFAWTTCHETFDLCSRMSQLTKSRECADESRRKSVRAKKAIYMVSNRWRQQPQKRTRRRSEDWRKMITPEETKSPKSRARWPAMLSRKSDWFTCRSG